MKDDIKFDMLSPLLGDIFHTAYEEKGHMGIVTNVSSSCGRVQTNELEASGAVRGELMWLEKKGSEYWNGREQLSRDTHQVKEVLSLARYKSSSIDRAMIDQASMSFPMSWSREIDIVTCSRPGEHVVWRYMHNPVTVTTCIGFVVCVMQRILYNIHAKSTHNWSITRKPSRSLGDRYKQRYNPTLPHLSHDASHLVTRVLDDMPVNAETCSTQEVMDILDEQVAWTVFRNPTHKDGRVLCRVVKRTTGSGRGQVLSQSEEDAIGLGITVPIVSAFVTASVTCMNHGGVAAAGGGCQLM